MGPKPPVVLYHYDASPISTEIKSILTLKGIPHKRVAVANMPPRPELRMLGISYRRIPVLAIGNDIYCDSALIGPTLERRFPPSEGYGTIFPKRKGGRGSDSGVIKAYSEFYIKKALSVMVSKSIPVHKFGPAFVKDRSEWWGTEIEDAKVLEGQYPYNRSALASHLLLLEEQLEDGREWLMDTESPSLADISAHLIFNWVRFFKALRGVYKEHQYPNVELWLKRFSEHLEAQQKTSRAVFENISGEEGFDEIEASRLKVALGEIVSVSPSDNGKVPTIGKLVALSRQDVVIETMGTEGRSVICHFPRLEYMVQASSHTRTKL